MYGSSYTSPYHGGFPLAQPKAIHQHDPAESESLLPKAGDSKGAKKDSASFGPRLVLALFVALMLASLAVGLRSPLGLATFLGLAGNSTSPSGYCCHLAPFHGDDPCSGTCKSMSGSSAFCAKDDGSCGLCGGTFCEGPEPEPESPPREEPGFCCTYAPPGTDACGGGCKASTKAGFCAEDSASCGMCGGTFCEGEEPPAAKPLGYCCHSHPFRTDSCGGACTSKSTSGFCAQTEESCATCAGTYCLFPTSAPAVTPAPTQSFKPTSEPSADPTYSPTASPPHSPSTTAGV
eukprot:CAMPEP_0172609730 /NCGR_PEP_ID=MMETSP1068-20121228/29651_1 /TAXON_ID=35684 /ORGANISM="Pseudopedinella elastica, Strain CCMP716" /LENGTH=290 /DNA_ID=CAMNT_0013413301 /DNA_START=35 /DNA_END=907 /DNA_ORIENTATION=-